MDEIKLRAKEQKKYEVIKNLVDNGEGDKESAAAELGCTLRHVCRLIRGYKDNGKAFFSHGNKGRKPATTFPDEKRENIVRLYREKYNGYNFTDFTRLLIQNEGVKVSVGTVTKFLEAENIYSPRITKKKKKLIANESRNK